MHIDSGLVGAAIRGRDCAVDWRQTTNYAAAVGDANPAFLDDERPGGLLAHPLMATALTWPISEALPQRLEAAIAPEIFLTQVHYSETLIFHRPIRPGDQLTITGQVAAALPARAGTHVIARYDCRDADGRPVFSEFSGVMLRGVACADQGRALELPATPVAPMDATEIVWEKSLKIGPLAPYVYDGCTGIVFAIHTSPAFAHAVGLPGVILQGTATLAMAASAIIERQAAGDPTRLRSLSCRFTGMVRPDSQIAIQLLAAQGPDCFFRVLNQDGQAAISRGHALVAPIS